MPDTLDAAAVQRWCGGGLALLRAHQHEIDGLNVYPVPDSDTGTNLVLTLAAAHDELLQAFAEELERATTQGELISGRQPSASATSLGRAMRRMARGALFGARGNSGVIIAQILGGMADSFATVAAVRGAELALALRSASVAAYAAVARPVEGTVLSVVAAAADGADRIKSDDLVLVAQAAARAAAEALARTPQQLPVLARAGVVDAGGRGLCLLLEALVVAVTPAADRTPVEPAVSTQVEPVEPASEAPPTPAYEVQYLLDADSAAMPAVRAGLAALGDSLVVIGTGAGTPPTWNVHVHVPAAAIGPALEAGIAAGRPHQITVTPLAADNAAQLDPLGNDGEIELVAPDPFGRGAVVVAAGEGLAALFIAEGAIVVGRDPSIAEMLAAIEATKASAVVLLPNDSSTHVVARSAAHEAATTGVQVSVVPTRSPVQALAALAVRDPQRAFADDVIAMAEAAGACRYGEVRTAQRAALTVAGPCAAGELLGLVDGEVHVIGADLGEVSRRLLDRLLGGGGELATLVLGADAPADLAQVLVRHVGQNWPFVEVNCYAGGQPRYHLLVGVE